MRVVRYDNIVMLNNEHKELTAYHLYQHAYKFSTNVNETISACTCKGTERERC